MHSTTLPARQLVGLLQSPPAKREVYRSFNVLRQRYILEQTVAHFKIRADEPAPLFGKKLLDVGCGESSISEFLGLSGADITAIDPNPAVLDVARASAEAFGSPVHFLQCRAGDLLPQGHRFDVILALDVAEDVDDLDRFIWTLKQLLAPGGMIIFSAINHTFKAWFMHIVLSERVYRRVPVGQRSYSRFYKPSVVKAVARKHGLTPDHVQYLRFLTLSQRWVAATGVDTRYLMVLR